LGGGGAKKTRQEGRMETSLKNEDYWIGKRKELAWHWQQATTKAGAERFRELHTSNNRSFSNMRLSLAATTLSLLAFASGVSADVIELTKENYEKWTDGKTVFIKQVQ
jgi:hypothetical protein